MIPYVIRKVKHFHCSKETSSALAFSPILQALKASLSAFKLLMSIFLFGKILFWLFQKFIFADVLKKLFGDIGNF